MPAATGIASHRVCAKTLDFVFGRSIGTKSVEQVGIPSGPRVLEYTRLTTKSSQKFPRLRFQPLQVAITGRKEQAGQR